MTSTVPVLPGEPTASPRPWATAIFATVWSGIGTAGAYQAAGYCFDFYLATFLLLMIIVPPLAVVGTARTAWMCSASAGSVVAGSWIIIGQLHDLPAGVTLRCIGLLVLVTIALVTAVQAGRSLVRSDAAASAAVLLMNLAWITWPVWLSSDIAGAKVKWSVDLNPLLTLNGELKDLGAWTEQPVAYHLTTLGQDISYHLPTSIGPSELLYLGITVVALAIKFSTRVLLKAQAHAESQRAG